ncbi:hypothetical protein MAPG_03662 [Magnaporthiopsis poae ATCC 64411]|uniref:Uncharacterized protein n=1 Tax=Magnaporthiopsis poae (strain ATCC 64411 / 73-15) TaxID=644358 RepID=A0A0C4DUM2_MAGP6|nr:hypothetical protein MAPG_03662 [Magnaporthiopsis poae ATCC 64411]
MARLSASPSRLSCLSPCRRVTYKTKMELWDSNATNLTPSADSVSSRDIYCIWTRQGDSAFACKHRSPRTSPQRIRLPSPRGG